MEERCCKSRARRPAALALAFLALLAAGGPLRADGGGILARVNGQTIDSRAVERGLREDLPSEIQPAARQERLQRLVDALLLDQALLARKVSLSESEVEQEFRRLQASPPMMTCGCCSFSTLDEYLRLNQMSPDDLRLEIRRNLALDKLIDQQWTQQHPEALTADKLSAATRKKVVAAYRKVYQIFTNAPLANDSDEPGKAREKQARTRIEQALAQIQAGGTFQEVARRLSEDKGSAAEGGLVGYLRTDRSLLGLVDQRRWPAMETRKAHGPLRSYAGYHLLWIEPLDDQDVLAVLKQEFAEQASGRIWQEICAKAKVEPESLRPLGGDPSPAVP